MRRTSCGSIRPQSVQRSPLRVHWNQPHASGFPGESFKQADPVSPPTFPLAPCRTVAANGFDQRPIQKQRAEERVPHWEEVSRRRCVDGRCLSLPALPAERREPQYPQATACGAEGDTPVVSMAGVVDVRGGGQLGDQVGCGPLFFLVRPPALKKRSLRVEQVEFATDGVVDVCLPVVGEAAAIPQTAPIRLLTLRPCAVHQHE